MPSTLSSKYLSEEISTSSLGLQVLFKDTSVYTESLGEADSIADLSQHFDQALNLGGQPQSTPFDHHQPLPPLSPVTPVNISTSTSTAKLSELCLG